jgi:class 3 adenylate cyclase/tetratricopeptide (TPR) repeat protein
VPCPSCAGEIPEGAGFCPWCGRALHVAVDERRVVTVLFGDIVGFTGFSETRDPEQVKNLVDRCFAALADDIRSFGGTVDKVIGDAVVALFGAPIAHEDDAERAVRAAHQMLATLAGMASEIGVDVRMRIGINTGEVLVGQLRAGGDYTAMGDVVNTASRLQTSAQPGTVVVGPDTYAATKDVFRYEPLGLLQAKGREAAIETWVAHEPILEPGRRRNRRWSDKLIGRDRELALVDTAVQNAFETRRPTMIVILGEAGMGKSRLSQEVGVNALARGPVRFLTGRGMPYGSADAAGPISEAMRSACGITQEDDETMARAKIEATVDDFLPGLVPEERHRMIEGLAFVCAVGYDLSIDVERLRDDAAFAARVLVEAIAERQPVLVTLGDMHWAHPGVLVGLERLLQRIERGPVVVLLAARPAIFDEWRPTVGENLVVLNLEPLDQAASAELLTTMLGYEPEPAVRDELVERAGGNPLFLEELARYITEQGGAASAALPATLRGLVAERLDALTPHERDVLEDAAVTGHRAPIRMLLALSDDGLEVEPAIAELVSHGLLLRHDEEIEFRSDLIREVVYGVVTKAERARRHARLAAWLDGLPVPAGDERLAEAARHWATAAEVVAQLGQVDGVPADVKDRAVAAMRRTIERATDREAYDLVRQWTTRLLDLLGPDSTPLRRETLVARAMAAAALRLEGEALADLDAIEPDARASGDEATVAAVLLVRGDLLRNRGDLDGSLEALSEARTLMQRIGDRRGEGGVLRRMGWALVFSGHVREAEPVLEEALLAFRESGTRNGEAWAMQSLAWIAFGRGDVEAAVSLLDQSEAIFSDLRDVGGLIWAGGMRAWLELGVGNFDGAERLAADTMEQAEEREDLWQVAMMRVLLASVRLRQGRMRDAMEEARRSLDQFAALGDRWGEARAKLPLARALLLLGRVDEARALVDDPLMLLVFDVAVGEGSAALAGLEERALAVSELNDLAVVRALALLQDGQVDASLEILRGRLEDTPERGPRVPAVAAHALALAAAGKAEEARAVAIEAIATAVTYSDRALAYMASAAAAARLGDGAAVRADLEALATMLSGTEDVLSTNVARLAAAHALAAVGDPEAAAVAREARERLARSGIEGAGWDRIFSLATGATAVPGAPARG